MKGDRLSKHDIDLLEKASYDASVASSLCSQTSMFTTLTKRTQRELHKTAVELTGISARLSRIAILTHPKEIG